jgi:hypothetical protein
MRPGPIRRRGRDMVVMALNLRTRIPWACSTYEGVRALVTARKLFFVNAFAILLSHVEARRRGCLVALEPARTRGAELVSVGELRAKERLRCMRDVRTGGLRPRGPVQRAVRAWGGGLRGALYPDR